MNVTHVAPAVRTSPPVGLPFSVRCLTFDAPVGYAECASQRVAFGLSTRILSDCFRKQRAGEGTSDELSIAVAVGGELAALGQVYVWLGG